MIKLLIIAIAITIVIAQDDINSNGIRRHHRKTRQETARWYNDGWHSSPWPTYSPSSSSYIKRQADIYERHSRIIIIYNI